MLLPHRYLRQFDSRRLPHFFTDVLIAGAGIAGLRAALEFPPDVGVLVFTKDRLAESNSSYAQGGLAGVLDPEDQFENHVEDTLRAGAGLCDPSTVEMVVRAAPGELAQLVEWGTQFDEESGGRLALTLEGGHSHRRIVHALGDATGQEVMRALIARARAAANLQMWENTFLLDLITEDGRCVGMLASRPDWGLFVIRAHAVLLASGGAGQLFRETTNPAVATGDGMAAAYRAGATLADMEFMQFHPTVLYVAGSARHLISEAVRGEGAFLRDKHGHRFMPEYDPRAELAPRDIVARAIIRQMEKTRHPNVYLDLSHLDRELVARRFPGIAKVCQSFDLELATDRIPVRPASHYMIGGVRINEHGQTSLPGLWAAGEVTSSGLHGANRLASNSLIEGLVFGTRCAQSILAALRPGPAPLGPLRLVSRFTPDRGPLDVADVRNALQSLMGRQAGMIRDQAGLEQAREDLAFWQSYVLAHEFAEPAGWELQNLVTLATLMVDSALLRTESRGVHFRADYPNRDDENWLRRLNVPGPEFATV